MYTIEFFFFFFFLCSGAGSRELPEANRFRSAQFPVSKDTSTRIDCIGARGGFHRGPRFTTPHNEIRDERIPPLEPKRK